MPGVGDDIIQQLAFGGPLPRPGGPASMAPAPGRGADPAQDQVLNDWLLALKTFLRDVAITASHPAHVEPNFWSKPIDLSTSINVAAAAFLPDVWTTAISFVVPEGTIARFSAYGLNVRDPAYTYDGSLIWRIQVGGNSVTDLNGFAQQRGTIAEPRTTFFTAKQGQTVTFQVRREVAALLAQDVEMALVGWLWIPRNEWENSRAALVY